MIALKIQFQKDMRITGTGNVKKETIFERMAEADQQKGNNHVFIRVGKKGNRLAINNQNLLGVPDDVLNKWKDKGVVTITL